MFWNWLRAQVKAAILGGVDDAIKELNGAEGEPALEVPDLGAALRARMTALPPPLSLGEPETNGTAKRAKAKA